MNQEKDTQLSGRNLAEEAVSLARSKIAGRIVMLNPGAGSGIAEWIVICQGSNEIHNRAVADEIIAGLKRKNTPPWHTEGLENGRWILLDYSDVVINIILADLRAYYALDDLWEKCPRIEIEDDR
jgi:ribosome-associated protein